MEPNSRNRPKTIHTHIGRYGISYFTFFTFKGRDKPSPLRIAMMYHLQYFDEFS